jgi:hypothetical protein
LEAQTWNFFYKNAQKGTERWDQPKQILMPTLGLNAKKKMLTLVLRRIEKKSVLKKRVTLDHQMEKSVPK